MIELHDNQKYDLDDRLSYLKEISGGPNGLSKSHDGAIHRSCRLAIKQKVRLTKNLTAVFKVSDYD